MTELSPQAQAVRSIVRIIIFIKRTLPSGRSWSDEFASAFREGDGEVDDNAEMTIIEFVKDGIHNLSQQQIDTVAAGDYSMVWKMVNDSMKGWFNLTPRRADRHHPVTTSAGNHFPAPSVGATSNVVPANGTTTTGDY